MSESFGREAGCGADRGVVREVVGVGCPSSVSCTFFVGVRQSRFIGSVGDLCPVCFRNSVGGGGYGSFSSCDDYNVTEGQKRWIGLYAVCIYVRRWRVGRPNGRRAGAGGGRLARVENSKECNIAGECRGKR